MMTVGMLVCVMFAPSEDDLVSSIDNMAVAKYNYTHENVGIMKENLRNIYAVKEQEHVDNLNKLFCNEVDLASNILKGGE